jgi:hypothetical protein
MGSIDFEGWNVEVDDIELLNKSPEVAKLGLVFEQYPGLVSASAKGNVSAYYVVLQEVKRRLVSGGFNVDVELNANARKSILLTPDSVTEDGKDMTFLFQ